MKLIRYKSVFDSKKRIFSNDVVLYLLKAIESADYQLCVDIENDLVKIGKRAVKHLAKALEHPHPKVRSHSAMALIRIGAETVEYFRNESVENQDLKWVVDFILSEISGSEKTLAKEETVKTIAS